MLAAASDTLLFRSLAAGMSAFVSRSGCADEVVAGIRHAAVSGSSFSANGLAEAVARRHRPTGGALLSAGSWLFMMAAFAGAYLVAPIVKRAWR